MAKESLSLEERLSPIKFSSLDLFPTVDEEENLCIKAVSEERSKRNGDDKHAMIYPHGLHSKHETRRNTIQQPYRPLNTPENYSKRSAFTSPRLSIPALFPPNVVDSITESPSYRVRSRRISNGTKTITYSQGIGKRPSRLMTSGGTPDEESSASKRRLNSQELDSSDEGHNGEKSEPPSRSDPTITDQVADPGNIEEMLVLQHVSKETFLSQDINVGEESRALAKIYDSDHTANVLESPSSKPIYSMRFVHSIQEKYLREYKELEEIILLKNLSIKDLSASNKEKDDHIMNLEHKVTHLQRKYAEIEISNESLSLQLEQVKSDLERAGNKIKHRDSQIYHLNERLVLANKKNETESIASADEIHRLQEQLKEYRNDLLSAQNSLADTQNESELFKKELELELSRNCDLKNQLAAVSLERDSLQLEINSLRSIHEEQKIKVSNLLEALASSSDAQNELNSKFTELHDETQKLQEDMVALENYHRESEAQLCLKNSEIEKLQSELALSKTALNSMEASLEGSRSLAEELESHRAERIELLERLLTLEARNQEKDKIISGDTKKLSQLVTELSHQKQLLSEVKSTATKTSIPGDDQLLQQITNLKRQVASAQQKTEERIQEVAEQLFHQYSKKHEQKVNQLKEKYESKLEEKRVEINSRLRQIDSMESRLRTEEKEKNYLLQVLEKSGG